MSVQAIAQALKIRGVSPSEKLVLMVLANYADEHNRSFPSHRRLSDETGLSERTILSVMKALEARDLLVRQERKRPDGSRSTDLITLNLGGEIISPRGEIDGGGVGKPLRGGGEMVSPLTTFEPSVNRQDEPVERASAPRAKKTRRCPDQWSPSKEDLAAVDGLMPGEIERELAKFRDHEFRTPRSDWSAAFRNWLRKAAEIKSPNERHHNSRLSPSDARRADTESRRFAWADEIAERDGLQAGPDAGGAPSPDGNGPRHLRLAHAG